MAELKISVNCGLRACLLLALISSAFSQGDEPPHIGLPNSQAPQIVDIPERLGYTVTCAASGHPVPTLQWKRDGILLSNNQESIQVFTNGTLYFKNFTDHENGIYQCLATNQLGMSMSVNVPIWNTKPAGKHFASIENEKQSVQAGDPLVLKCGDTPDTIPKWNKRWYLSIGSTEVKVDNRISTDLEGNLRFAYTTNNDATSYSCGLVPPALRPSLDITMYKTIQLTVIPSDTDPKRPLQIAYYSGSTAKGILGDDIVLECFFTGNPLPNITWKHGNSPITDLPNDKFAVADSGRQLRISRLRDDDEGEYVCEGSNGFDTQKEIIFVNVTSPPMRVPYHGLINTVTPDRGHTVLKCHTKASHGENLNIPSWFRNGKPLINANLPDPARYSFNNDYTELQITNPNKTTDTACFQCNISNSEGYTFYDAYLRVIESIIITKQPDPVNEIYSNQALDISILATGDSCCTISNTWYLNDVRLTQEELDQPPFRKDQDGSLWFDPRNMSQETLTARTGSYQCNVSSIYDFRTVEFTISVTDRAVEEPFVAVNGGYDLWWIVLICVLLLLIIAAIIIFIVVKRNYPSETYPLEETEIQHHLNPKEELLNFSFQEL